MKFKEKVKEYLKAIKVAKSPTEIGLAIGKDYNSASSSVNLSLKSLVKDGLVIKIKTGQKVFYKWNVDRDKVEIMLRWFRTQVFDGMESELLFDEELFQKWLKDHWYLIEE